MLTDSLLSKIIHTLYFPRAYTILQGSEMLCPFFFMSAENTIWFAPQYPGINVLPAPSAYFILTSACSFRGESYNAKGFIRNGQRSLTDVRGPLRASSDSQFIPSSLFTLSCSYIPENTDQFFFLSSGVICIFKFIPD